MGSMSMAAGRPQDRQGARERADPSGNEDQGGRQIRRAVTADAPVLAGLCRQEARMQETLGGYALVSDFDWTAWLTARLTAPGCRIFVAERDGEIIGYVFSQLRSPGADGRGSRVRAWRALAVRAARTLLRRVRRGAASAVSLRDWGMIESLYVVASERRQGLGSRLVNVATADLAALGVNRIQISVTAANEAAMAFWSKRGFCPFRIHMLKDIRGRQAPDELQR
jgi:GNAT superfamily N-acetyltransferase